MSNHFITDIIGDGDFAIPTDDTTLADATTALDAALGGIGSLAYDRVLAWVQDSGQGGGTPVEGTRTLNCLIEKFTWSGEECPSEGNIDAMISTIESTLVASHTEGDITAIGFQYASCFQPGTATTGWSRNTSSGFVYPSTITDAVAVGGGISPDGKWFADGDLVLGASVMSGTEKLRVVGDARVEGKLTVTGLIDPTGLVLDEQASVPGGAPAAGKGTLWVKNDTPNTIWFTDDAGSHYQLGASPWLSYAGTIYPTTYATNDVVVGDNSSLGDERLLVINKNPASGAVIAIKGAIDTDNTGVTVTSWRAFQALARIEEDDTLDLARHYEVMIPVGTGNIGTAVGLYINDLKNGTATVATSFGIWQDGSGDTNVLYGDTVVGGSSMSSDEKFKVEGAARIEKYTSENDEVLYVVGGSNHPTTESILTLAHDVATSIAPTLKIDSAVDGTSASGAPLIELQPLNANKRGDIAFGTARSGNPSAPAEGDFWYESTSSVFRYYDGSTVQTFATGSSNPWSSASGVIYPTTFAVDDVAIGASSMVGVERFLVINKDPTATCAAIFAGIDTPSSSATISAWDGVMVFAQVDSTDTISDAKFLHVASPAGTGAITTATGLRIDDIDGGAATVGTAYGIYQDGTGDLNVFRGDVAIASTSMSGTEALRVSGDVLIDSTSKLTIADSATKPPLNITERSTEPSAPAAGDIYLDDGTNTASGNPGWRRYTGAVWEDISAGGGGGSSPWTYSSGVIYPTNDVDDDTVAIGVNAMSGAGEMLRIVCDPDEGEYIGVLASDSDSGSISGGTWAGFVARGITSVATSGSFTGFRVQAPVAGYFYGYSNYGFVVDDMAGTGMSTMIAFYQAGSGQANQFNGYIGVGGAGSSTLGVKSSTPASGISAFHGEFQAYRNVNNTGTSPGPDWAAYDAWIVQPNTTVPHYIRDVYYYRVQAPLSSVAVTIRNAYGLHIANMQTDADFTYTNTPYGIYQAGADDLNYFAGTVLCNTTSPSASGDEKVRARGNASGGSDTGFYADYDAPGSASGVVWHSFESDVDVPSTNNVTLAAHFVANTPSPNTTPGTLQNCYGLIINAQKNGSLGPVTSGWGVFQSGAYDRNYFNSRTGFGTTTLDADPYYVVRVTRTEAPISDGQSFYYVSAEGRHVPSSGAINTSYFGCFNAVIDNQSGTITNAYGLRVDGWSNTATIARGYGVFIDNLVGTTTYGIYQNGDTTKNFFDGPIALGVDTLGTSSALEISSTTKALVVSRMSTTQRGAMTAAAGMIIFNTTDSKFQGYDGSGWVDLN